MRERKQASDPQLSKLSRYQRERLIYGYLKKELVKLGCVDDESIAEGQECGSEESVGSSEGEHRYSMKERKQSLLSKLNIFNRSVNFDDLKNTIETAIQQQHASAENQRERGTGGGRREQKIV